jgi:phosphocarrier protein
MDEKKQHRDLESASLAEALSAKYGFDVSRVSGDETHGYSTLVKIKSTYGIHARPSSKIVKVASKQEYENCEPFLIYEGYEAGAKSIMNLMLLGAKYDSDVQLRVTGKNSLECILELGALLETNLDA